MILDNLFENYPVTYPFRITRFRFLYEHRWAEDFLFLGESHNFWEFSCVLEGEVEVVLDGKIHLVKPGNFIGCPPMVFHSSRAAGKACRVLNFSFEQTGKLPEKFGEGIFYLTPPETEKIKRIFENLRQAYCEKPVDDILGAEAANALSAFLLRISQLHDSHHRPVKSRSGEMYQRLVETMKATVRDNLTVQQIAERNAISVSTMKELFRKYAGISPKRYYADMRGVEALRLLQNGMEIGEITELLNYSSPNYFSSSFKRQFGVPPGRYRRQNWK